MVLLGLLAIACAAPAAAPPPGPSTARPAAAPGAEQPAWQQEWEAVLAAAKQEGRVVVAGTPGDTMREAMVDGFGRAYPEVTLEWSGLRGNDALARISAERQGGLTTIDVTLAGTENTAAFRAADALAPIAPGLILPDVTDGSKWLGGQIAYSDGERAYNPVFISTVPALLAYNPSQVRPEEVEELEQLLDPKWKGRLVLHDPNLAGTPQAVARWLWHTLGPERATEFLRALAAQQPVVDRETRRELEWVARGRYALLLGPSDSLLRQLSREGLQFGVKNSFRDVGGYLSASAGSALLMQGAPHPDAARVFLNWLLSRDGQLAYSTAVEQPSRRLDVPRDHLAPASIPASDVTYWPSFAEGNLSVPPELERLLKELFTS
ncbi:MAG TPA: extracellular solute-binding protein [Chloroflexota bacterium]|jgi:iron(III) transport system substrate-binding protein